MPILVLEDIGGLQNVERTAPSRRGATDPDQPVATEKKERQYPKTEASATNTGDSPAAPLAG